MKRIWTNRGPAWHALSIATLLTLVLAPLHAVAAQAKVLDKVPADAPLVVVLPSLSGLSQKIAMLHDALGLQQPEMANMLGEFKSMTGMTQGLDDTGTLAVVITDVSVMVDGAHGPPPVVVLAPVKDYAAFVSNYGGAAGDAISSLTMPDGQAAFARPIEGYAVMGSSKQAVEEFQATGDAGSFSKRLGKLDSRSLKGSDAVILLNFDVLAPALLPKLAEARQQMLAEMGGAQNDNDTMELATAFLSLYMDGIETVLTGGSTFAAGFDLSERGVGLTSTLAIKADSELSGYFQPPAGPGATPYLAKLSKQAYIAAMGMDCETINLGAIIERISAKLPQQEQAQGIAALIGPSLELTKPIKGVSVAYYQGDQMAMMGGAMVKTVSVIHVDNSKIYLADYQAYMQAINNVKIALDNNAGPGGEGASISITAAYTPNALQIDDVQVDDYQVQYEFPPQMMQQLGPMAPMMMMMGATGQSGYIAAKDGYVVLTSARDAKLMKQALAAIDHGNGLGVGDSLAQVRADALPDKPSMEWYLSVPGLVNGTVNMFLAMMGQQPLNVPPDLPPIGAALTIEDGGLYSRTFVPMSVVQFGKDLIDQAQQMQAGQRGGHASGQQGGPPPAPF